MLVDVSGQPDASVVVCAYKSRGTIERCLESLLAQDSRTRTEIIVVESSGDGTADIIRERFPLVRLIESPHRLFSGAARNVGAQKARGEFLLFIDSDCVAEPSWTAKMVSALTTGDCTVAGGSILNGNPESAVSVAGYISEFSHFFPFGNPRFVDYLPTGNCAYRTQVFRKYAGFENEQPLYVDLMFNKALSRAGEKLLFDPDIRVWHWNRTALREHLDHQWRRGRAAAVARRKGLLTGGEIVRYPFLSIPATPVLFLRKVLVFPIRYARAYPRELTSLAKALPVFLLGMLYWHSGFLNEALRPSDVQAGQEKPIRCARN